jgi:hypothetical protein
MYLRSSHESSRRPRILKEETMKLFRLVLVCGLLLLAATPTLAFPCRGCSDPEYPYCQFEPGSGYRCINGPDWCELIPAPSCNPFTAQTASAMLAEWTVASIETTRPAEGAKVVITPAAVAEAGAAPSKVRK